MPPKTLAAIAGQNHLIGKQQLLSLMIEHKRLFSIIFFGPSGVGKSSLIHALGHELNIKLLVFHATKNNKQDLVSMINLALMQPIPLLIIEEIHQLNKDKQDYLLDYLENQQLLIWATTTENPYFALIPPLRSRVQLLELHPITVEQLSAYWSWLANQQLILTNFSAQQKQQILVSCGGDIRHLLNVLNKCNWFYHQEITNEQLALLLNVHADSLHQDYDDWHNLKSALQKSIRGSDVQASLYYLARLLVSGDLKTIVRRLVICAYEDIGLANMPLCSRVAQTLSWVLQVGMPEAINLLGPMIVEMALSPKSNAGVVGLTQAYNHVRQFPNIPIPKHLHDDHYHDADKLGVKGYLFPHDYPYSYCEQQYLPDQLVDQVFYQPNLTNPTEVKWLKYWQTLMANFKPTNQT